MRVGSIVLATKQGLGFLAKDFYDNGVLDDVLVKKSVRFKDNVDWYPDAKMIGPRGTDFADSFDRQDVPVVVDFLSKIDVLFLFEIPFYNNVILLAQQMGVKVVLMPMYECSPFPIHANAFICPSELDLQYYQKMYPDKKSIFLPVPVPNEVTWRKREKAEVFVHNAGNGGALGRNGTAELVEAMKYVKSPIKMILRSQKLNFNITDERIEYIHDTVPFEELWSEGDVFIFPEKFNGLSLPLQEAYASGMLVMTSDRFPNDTWLPKEPLIPIAGTEKASLVNVPFDMARLNAKDIAAKIDEWYGKDISKFSLSGKKWGEENSWGVLKDKYREALREL